MDDQRILKLLRAACEKAGSQRAWAKAHGIAPAYPNLVLTGRRRAGPQILAALGLTRVSRITKKAPADAE
jgi:hypothetical protein